MARLELMDTVELMGSSDYRDRFVAEYIQLKIRYEKLKAFNTKIEAARRTGSLDEGVQVKEPKHDCPAGLLREQQAAMGEYLHLLEVRAVIEDIDIPDGKFWLEDRKREAQNKEPETNSVVDERATVAVSDTDDEWELLSEVIGKIIERGLVADADEEKLMAAGLNVLHKIKKLEEQREDKKENTKGITESVDPDDVDPDSIKSSLKCCTSTEDDCDKCYFNNQENRYCCDNLLRASLRYIVKLEEAKNGKAKD